MRCYRNILGKFLHILTEVLVKKPLLLKHYYTDNKKNALENSCNKKMHWKTRAILKNNYLSVSGEFIISCIV